MTTNLKRQTPHPTHTYVSFVSFIFHSFSNILFNQPACIVFHSLQIPSHPP